MQRQMKTLKIYIADMNSLTLCSMVEKTIGVQLRKDESLSTLISQVFADHTDKVLNLGVILSPSTQSQVLSMYCPIYDNDGNPIGFVGMALCAEQLLTELNELEFVGLTDCNNIILDVQKGNYIISRAKEKYGQAIDDENYLTLVEQIKKDQSYDLLDTSYKDVDTSKNKIAVYRYLPDRDWIVLVEVSETSLFASINQLVSILLVACAIILIICVISVFVITDTELRGVTHVAAAINEVAGLNISDHPAISRNLKRQDEVGILANAAQRLVTELRSIIIGIQKNSSCLTEESKTLNQLCEQNKESVGHVELAVEDIANGAGSQSEETQKASDAVIQIGDMIEKLSEQTVHVHNNADEMQEISSKVVSTLSALKEINQKTEESVTEVHKQTNQTNESIMKIQSAVAIIASIANETSLLSLNASIEAARAGEQGRGFSVVATQIKKLAEQSNTSTKEINEIIATVMRDSQATVTIMQQVQENVRIQTKQMEETLAAFQQLSVEIEESIDGINIISEQTKKMDRSRIEVVDVATNLSAIAQQNAASTEETSASVSFINESMLDLADMAKKLEELAHSIDAEISGFTIEA